jgi:predicted GNAT family acetyltransferase
MHVIKAFTHMQVKNIPEKYILRCYTRNARSVVPWDRHDVRVATHADTEQTRMSKLLPKLMCMGRAGRKSDRSYAMTV